jgi:hypothetical protein
MDIDDLFSFYDEPTPELIHSLSKVDALKLKIPPRTKKSITSLSCTPKSSSHSATIAGKLTLTLTVRNVGHVEITRAS